jgi:hypothetical protein
VKYNDENAILVFLIAVSREEGVIYTGFLMRNEPY